MKTLLSFIIVVLGSSNLLGQISSQYKKKIEHILGEGFNELPSMDIYPYSSLENGVEIDTSTTIVGDTTGAHYKNEYVLFRSFICSEPKPEVLKLIKDDVVTNGEFQEFQHYVRDSIARDKIFFGLESDDGVNEYILYDEDYYNEGEGEVYEWKNHNADREFNREIFPLNWKKKFYYDDPDIMPILADMYIPVFERFYRKRVFDTRKWPYRYIEVENRNTYDSLTELKAKTKNMQLRAAINDNISQQFVNVANDDYYWAMRGSNNFDEYASLSQLYSITLKDEPVIGVLGTQASAFCHWKQERLQKELDNQELPYYVLVTLPVKEDLNEIPESNQFSIAERDYTDQWGITCKEYTSFVNAVKDSMKRELLYIKVQEDKLAEKLLHKTDDLLMSESRLEWVEFDPADRLLNRELYFLNYKTNISNRKYWQYDKVGNRLNLDLLIGDPVFHYSYIDCYSRSQLGKFTIEIESVDPPSTDYYFKYYESDLKIYDSTGQFEYGIIGKDLWIPGLDKKNHDPGVRAHTYVARFFNETEINVIPGNLQELNESDDLIQSISYEQAMAYYHWKYPIQNANERSDWQNFVSPTKEQFEKAQRGEQLVIGERKVPYPTPLFRYVVHVFPK